MSTKVAVIWVLVLGAIGLWTVIDSKKEGPRPIKVISSEPMPETFHGYACTQNCSGHEAGFQWARNNDITDKDDCTGNSQSFIEGCEAYVDDEGSNDSDSAMEPDGEDN
jgi:hypothetical protein